jgi:hypothetical protein
VSNAGPDQQAHPCILIINYTTDPQVRNNPNIKSKEQNSADPDQAAQINVPTDPDPHHLLIKPNPYTWSRESSSI